MRVAVIEYSLCKPTKCNLECIRFCPVNRSRAHSKAIEMDKELGKPVIYEDTCIGCNICVKKCPFNAISIENVPDELEKRIVHQYGVNSFRLYGLPVPKKGMITGIIGKNGTGKTTSIRILAGELVPNLGDFERKNADWSLILERFRGSELQPFFEKLSERELKVAHKIQYIDLVPKKLKGKVGELMEKADERGIWRELSDSLALTHLIDRDVNVLSGGELQRMLIAVVLSKDADVYIFDEPSSYLDVKERINVSQVIREYLPATSYGIVVEHDLAMLDYLSDNIHIIYGEPGVYGIVSQPYGTRAGINNFLEGYLPAENMRIRKEPIIFHYGVGSERKREGKQMPPMIEWGRFELRINGFRLLVEPGEAKRGEIMGIVGPNGIGKTTFVRTLAGELSSKNKELPVRVPTDGMTISYKPQYVSHELFEGTVAFVLRSASPYTLMPGHWLYDEITRPLRLNKMKERTVKSLSGGELQKLAIAHALAKDADVYLLDEPSAYLDVEERLTVAKVIRRLTESREVCAFVVEHDVSIIDYISDRLIVFRGTPGKEGHVLSPKDIRNGMNIFLRDVDVTFRRDPQTGRPRINKRGSFLDRKQKVLGEFYYMSPSDEKA